MKRIFTLFLIVSLLIVALTLLSSCGKATEGLEFYEYGDGYSVGISDGKYLDKIVIPKEHEGKKVVAIAKKGFLGCENAVTISLPNTITEIGEGAFQNCYKLEEIELPNGVKSIGKQAFKGCKSLKEITITDGVTSVGELAFSNCRALSSVTISNTVTELGNNAFEGCTAITSVTIPSSVTAIGEGIFTGCTALTNISVDESSQSYKSIDGNLYTKDGAAFIQYALGKKEFEFVAPDTVTSVGAYAFAGNTALTKITLPGAVTRVGDKAFDDCPIENATVPVCAIKEISQDNLKIIEINGGDAISKNAFRNSQLLKRVTISGVKEIGDSSFYNCVSLREVTIGEGLEKIDEYAFKGCVYLSDISLPDSLKEIGANAFKDCNRLTKIVIPLNVEEIGMYAFEGCASIRLYCRTAKAPEGWNKWWAENTNSKYTITWGYMVDMNAAEMDIPLYDKNGLTENTFNIADNKNGVTVITFWGTWCEPSLALLPDLDRLATEHDGKIKVLAIHTNGLSTPAFEYINENFPDSKILFGRDLPNSSGKLTDPEEYYSLMGGFEGTYPITLVVDQNGVITAHYVGAFEYSVLNSDIKKLLK